MSVLKMMRKIYLHLFSSISAFSLIAQCAGALAEPSELTIVSSEQIVINNPLTSVSQLADVQSTDWTFQALQSLVERYECIADDADGIYRGNRALTRYEFASGLNACLERVNELIATATANQITTEDMIALQRLQAEFSAELATMRDRIDVLNTTTTQLETNQFSTTTKLSGQVVWAVNAGGFSGDRIINPRGVELATEDPNATILYRASVDFNTSFSGTDLLKVRLNTGSDRARDNAAGLLEPTFGSFLEFSLAGTDDQFSIARLHYSFTLAPDISVVVGPVLATFDFVDRNSYANLSFRDFSTQALVNNFVLLPLPVGSGVFVNWNPGGGSFSLRGLYVAADAANPNATRPIAGSATPAARPVSPFIPLLYPNLGGNSGLFGDPYQGIVEMEYAPSKAFAVRLQYSGGNIFDGQFDVFGINFELALSQQLAVFSRYGYSSYDNTAFGDINPNYWMAGIAFTDLFVPGVLAGIAAGQPFIDNAVGNATQTNIEAFYNFPINDNMRITPLVQVIIDPGNQNSNGTIVTGTLRSVFSF